MRLLSLVRWCAVAAAVSSSAAAGMPAALAAPAAATTGRLGLSPTAIAFTVGAGEHSAPQPVSVVNGSPRAVHIAGLTSSDPRFVVGPGCGGQSLAAGSRCTATVTYVDDGATTSASTSLSGAGALTVPVTATVVPPLAAVPDVLFPSTFVGDTAPGVRTIVVRNNSRAPLTLASSVDVPATGLVFRFDTCLGRTLAPGGTCPVSVRYQPRAGLPDTAAVTLPTADGSWSTVVRATGISRARIAADEASLQWDDIQVGATARRVLHVRNTAPGTVTVTAVTVPADYAVADDGCTGVALHASDSCSVGVDYTPSVGTDAAATLTVSSTGGTLAVPLGRDHLRPFLLTPTALDFGAQTVGSESPTQDLVVTNRTAVPQRLVTSHGAFPQFRVTEGCAGVLLAPGASCRIGVAFAPTAAQPVTLTNRALRIDGLLQQVSLRGTGVTSPSASRLRVTPTALDFGDVDTTAAAVPQTVTVTNQGTAPVTLTGSLTRPAEFQVADPCTGTRLAPGASCLLTVRARPATTGESRYAQVTMNWNHGLYQVQFGFRSNVALALEGQTNLGAVELGGTVSGVVRFVDVDVDVGHGPITLSGPPPLTSLVGAARVDVVADGCTGVTLQPGDDCPVTVSVTPDDTDETEVGLRGAWEGNLVVAPIILRPASWFTVDATALALGVTGRAQPQPGRVVLTNVGSTTRSMPACSAGAFGIAVTGCAAGDLAPGASRTVSAVVATDGNTHAPGALQFLDSATGSFARVQLTGDDVPDLVVPGASLLLGPQAVGTPAPVQQLWVLNASDHDVTADATAYDFVDDGVTFTSHCDHVVLHADQGCAVDVVFTPARVTRYRSTYTDLFLGNPGVTQDLHPTFVLWGY